MNDKNGYTITKRTPNYKEKEREERKILSFVWLVRKKDKVK